MIMGNGVSFYSSPYGSAPFIGLLSNCNQGGQPTPQAVQSSYYGPPYQQPAATHQVLNNEQDNGSLLKLYDFDTNNQSELIRLIFYYAGISFKDKRVKQEEWERVKDHIPVQRLPILRVNNHFKIYYFNSIVRYLAREYFLYGTGNQEYAIVDMIFDTSCAFQEKLFEKINSTTSAEQRKTLLSQFIAAHATNHLNRLEKFYKIFNRDGPFYLGSQISLADLVVYQTMSYLIDIDPKLLDPYPHLKDARNRLEQHPQLVSYLNTNKNFKMKKKRHVTLSPTSHNVYHYYQRYQSHEGRRSFRHRRHQSEESSPAGPTKREAKPTSFPSKEKESISPLHLKQESKPSHIRQDEKESTPQRASEVIPQPPPVNVVILTPPPRVGAATPQPPPLTELVPQPPRLPEFIPQPPPVNLVIPPPPRIVEAVPQPPPLTEVIPQPPRITEAIPLPPPIVEPKPPLTFAQDKYGHFDC